MYLTRGLGALLLIMVGPVGLKWRTRKKNAPVTFEYLVRWRGFTEEDDTWEPPANLTGCKRLLKAYNKAHPVRM